MVKVSGQCTVGFSNSTPMPEPDLPSHDSWTSSYRLPFLLSVWTFHQECFPEEVVTFHCIGQNVFITKCHANISGKT